MSTQRDASPERTKSDVVYMVCRVNTPKGVFATRSGARKFLKNRITNKKSTEEWKGVSVRWIRTARNMKLLNGQCGSIKQTFMLTQRKLYLFRLF